MKNKNWNRALRVIGVMLMLIAFPIVPDHSPWYYGVILFDVGLVLFLTTKWTLLKKEIDLS